MQETHKQSLNRNTAHNRSANNNLEVSSVIPYGWTFYSVQSGTYLGKEAQLSFFIIKK